MANVSFHGNFINFCQEIGLIYVRMSIGVLLQGADVGGSNSFFTIVQKVFNFLHLDKPVDLLYCQFAKPILRRGKYLLPL